MRYIFLGLFEFLFFYFAPFVMKNVISQDAHVVVRALLPSLRNNLVIRRRVYSM